MRAEPWVYHDRLDGRQRVEVETFDNTEPVLRACDVDVIPGGDVEVVLAGPFGEALVSAILPGLVRDALHDMFHGVTRSAEVYALLLGVRDQWAEVERVRREALENGSDHESSTGGD